MKRYCKFIVNVEDSEELIWERNKKHLITYENDEYYYFGDPVFNGISKKYEGELFLVVSDIKNEENIMKDEEKIK